jgi:hypothetical protein
MDSPGPPLAIGSTWCPNRQWRPCRTPGCRQLFPAATCRLDIINQQKEQMGGRLVKGHPCQVLSLVPILCARYVSNPTEEEGRLHQASIPVGSMHSLIQDGEGVSWRKQEHPRLQVYSTMHSANHSQGVECNIYYYYSGRMQVPGLSS